MKIYKLFISSLFLCWCTLALCAQDSSAVAQKPEKVESPQRYRYRIGLDLARAIDLPKNYMWNELQIERINTKNGIMYLELGAGSGSIQNENIQVQSSGSYFRFGIAQNIVYRAGQQDYETADIGIRYGGAWCRNSNVSYTYEDDRFGTRTTSLPDQNMYRHWVELSLGMKMMLMPRWYLGWTLRTAYKINFEDPTEISPVFIPGFGKGDARTAVSYSIYLSFLLGKNLD